jgi:DNA mismatch repair ATPase MutS
MIYDEFQDNLESFSELETRLSHLQPAEVLYPKGTSKPLVAMLNQWRKCR